MKTTSDDPTPQKEDVNASSSRTPEPDVDALELAGQIEHRSSLKKGLERSADLKNKLEPLPYSPLDSQNGEIRLLQLQPGENGHMECEMEHAFLSESPRYNCLSYVWGSPVDLVTIQINGSYIEVGRNLYTALCALRHHTKVRTFWIDAVCINQQDLDERADQVRQMKQIYSLSWKTIVWIQEATREAIEAVQLMRELVEMWPPGTPLPDPGKLASDGAMYVLEHYQLMYTPCLAYVFEAKWFQRAWTLQEIVLTKRATIWCGPARLSWDNMAWIIEQSKLAHKGLSYEPYSTADYDYRQGEHVRGFYKCGQPPELIKRLLGVSRFATDPRDQVFALLGCSNEPAGVEINYNDTVETVFENAARLTIRHGLLDFLLAAVHPLQRLTLPSWIPDFDRQRNFFPLVDYSCGKALEWNIAPFTSPGVLTLRGLQFSVIANVGRAVDKTPVPHLTILYDWERLILTHFLEDEMEILPYSEECRKAYGHVSTRVGCDDECLPKPRSRMTVSDIARHWRTRYETAKHTNRDSVGPGCSAYQNLSGLLCEEQDLAKCEVSNMVATLDENRERVQDYPTGETVAEAYFRTLLVNENPPLDSSWISIFTLSKLPPWNETYAKPYSYEYRRVRQAKWNDRLHESLLEGIVRRHLVILSND